MNRLLQNAIEHAQAELQQKHEEHIKALEAGPRRAWLARRSPAPRSLRNGPSTVSPQRSAYNF